MIAVDTIVEFQTDLASFGTGVVVALDESSDVVTIVDEDGQRWVGSIDLVTSGDE